MNQSKKLFLLSLSMLCFSAKASEEVPAAPNAKVKPTILGVIRSIPKTPTNLVKTTAVAFFIWSVVKFIATEPHNKPVRYSFKEILEGKNLPKNLKYLILDGLIGHKAKRPSLRTYPDGKVSPQLAEAYADQLNTSYQTATVVLRPGAEPKGIYGWTYEYAAPIVTAVGMVAAINKWRTDVATGLNDFVAEWGFDLSGAELEADIDSE